MQGQQAFGRLAYISIVSTVCMLGTLYLIGEDLLGVWISVAVFNLIRMVGALSYHFSYGPLAKVKAAS
eukprot:scaffold1414_cov384-Prasinococcus_capsulatus_cf.AAC.19